jgi:magnesium-transporting ATPase (P-type)
VLAPESEDPLGQLLRGAVLCNDADVVAEDGEWRVLGDPTEASLVVLARKAGIDVEALREAFPRKSEIPFDATIKAMATEHSGPDGASFLALKGSLDVLLDLSTLDETARRALLDRADEMSARALRILAVGQAAGRTLKGAELDSLRGQVQILGIVGQMDPPRTEVAPALEDCREAGIRVIMITGDQKVTGLAVAQAIGLADAEDLALDGRELDALSDEELKGHLEKVKVFARVHPAQKLRIVETLQKSRQVVAMTGDGVNDAPALSQADVGVAMGITGTEVAKEASKIVVTDDNFLTIVSAVAEGRLVYRNIKKVILLLFSTSAAEVVILLLSMIFGFPPPLTAVQILWNNLVSEGVIAGNLIMDPRDGQELKQAPIPPDEPLITRLMMTRMLYLVPTMILAALGWFVFRLQHDVPLALARTETFTVIFFCEWFNVLNCRSETKSGLSRALFRNPWLVAGLGVGLLLQVTVIYWRPLGDVFHTQPIDLSVLPILALVASPMLWVEEARKIYARRKAATGAA